MIPYSKQSINAKDKEAVVDVLGSPWLTQGPKIPKFEESLAESFQVNHAIACSSGTSALQLAYAAVGVDSDSAGIVPAITFAATANAFRYLGAEVKFCDVGKEDGLIDLNSLEKVMSSISNGKKTGTRVVSAVSLAGKISPLEDIYNLSQKYGFRVVEDASHSPGAFKTTAGGKKEFSGSCKWTDAATVSFHPVKHICCGEGGAVLTNSGNISQRAGLLRSHGITRETEHNKERPWYYEQVDLGWNFRLTDIQAALGIEQLSRLDSSIQSRQILARRYDNAFSGNSFTGKLERPPCIDGHAWHLYVIRFMEPGGRDEAYHFLNSRGIMTQVHYIPLYRHPYHASNYKVNDFPGAETYFNQCLSIPMHPELTEDEQEKVISSLDEFLN
jgi:UDP-4-amino-4,6-dideoxy-N-acetyl-beta-L-altrosamine transaminase